MTLKLKDAAGTVRTIKRLSIKDNGGTVRILQQLSLKDAGGTLRAIFASMTAAASPSNVDFTAGTPIPVNVTTNSTTATPTGGIGPYTYSWAITEILGGTWQIDSPTAATTTFTCLHVSPGEFNSATAECTVTDSVGSTAVTNPVDATAGNTG